jgi:hypothetical protein
LETQSLKPDSTGLVAVSGHVGTIRVDTVPMRIDFTSDNGRTTSATPALKPIQDRILRNKLRWHTYSVSLVGEHFYKIAVFWSAAEGQSAGNSDAGTLNLFRVADKITHDIRA